MKYLFASTYLLESLNYIKFILINLLISHAWIRLLCPSRKEKNGGREQDGGREENEENEENGGRERERGEQREKKRTKRIAGENEKEENGGREENEAFVNLYYQIFLQVRYLSRT